MLSPREKGAAELEHHSLSGQSSQVRIAQCTFAEHAVLCDHTHYHIRDHTHHSVT